MYNEIDNISSFLSKYIDKDVIYIPNTGNAGDDLIEYSTYQLFNSLKLKYTIGSITQRYKDCILFYGGGGNLIGLYNECKDFMNNNHLNNKIVLLPHTIHSQDNLLKNLNDNTIIFCREKISYDYVYKLLKHKSNVYLSKDLAFYLNIEDKYKNIIGENECNAFRTDIEKTRIRISKDNIDLSLECRRDTSRESVVCLINEINKYHTINTNRLHIAILSTLLGKRVNFYKNSYYKNESVFKYSLFSFENIKYLD